ncbi:MAG TPA: FkbO/Hyg5 family chorismatase [Amycolatopsis sp.]|nr:FkbO/Hyg5 family chorismatase [Amycolatopsis sp.]
MTSTHAPVSVFREIKDANRVTPGRHILGVVNFTTDCLAPTIDDGHPSASVHITGSAEEAFAEVWTSERPVTAGSRGSLVYAEDGEFLFCAAHIPESAEYVDATEAVYTAALALVEDLGYRGIFRIWHYISRLNQTNPSGLEVYREFCIGRARVLERYGITGDMPAATAIGSHGGGIVIYFLAARGATQVNIDNPRQVSPYYYPNRYSPKSPNFARVTYLRPDGGAEQFYVSGTAGILGHRTMHLGDVEQQCRLALANIAHVVGAANLSGYDIEPGNTLKDLDNIKVYVRRRADIDKVQRICREEFAESADVVFLNADICRSDLLVEVEGIVAREEATGARPWEALPAAQQPDWRANPAHPRVMDWLSAAEPLVGPEEIADLRGQLAEVAGGSARVLQLGDCAESFYESTPDQTALRITALDRLADRFGARTEGPVVAVGRLGGQYAKPRSDEFETVDGVALPAFRGHLINAEAGSAEARRHDPRRMVWAYHFSDEVQAALRAHRARPGGIVRFGPWSSHDALVMDYIGSLVRTDPATGDRFLSSTHFPWIGERTGDPDEAQVALLSLVVNPVAAKIGPRATPESVLRLCAVLDPNRQPGRLTLIVRMGHTVIDTALPPIVAAVRAAGHPVIWMSDPMHGNTVRLPSGVKTRYLDDLVAEATGFAKVLDDHRVHFGGLHLETAAYEVTECVGGVVRGEADLAGNYTSLCDPRMTFDQAAELIDRVF